MNDILMNEMAGRVGRLLQARKMFLVTAESCTGGGLAEIITRIPGSSHWFERGFVTYSNASKQELLGVDAETLNRSGAVSEETALAMAEGALATSHAHISVAITGIAGPEGGNPEKPVGTVYIAWAGKGMNPRTVHTIFQGDRLLVRQQSCLLALQGLIDLVESGK
ncbi:MAG: CinA family protein [Gammaproteobacteria bacterium]